MSRATKRVEQQEDLDRKAALRQAYGQATKELRDTYRETFNEMYAKAAAALGVQWSPRPSDEEQAAMQFDELLTRYPHLRDRVSADTETNEEGATE